MSPGSARLQYAYDKITRAHRPKPLSRAAWEYFLLVDDLCLLLHRRIVTRVASGAEAGQYLEAEGARWLGAGERLRGG